MSSKQHDVAKSLEECLKELSVADESVLRTALSGGKDQNLNDYSDKIKRDLNVAHRNAVKECIGNSDKLTVLHNSIVQCDNVFEHLEEVLVGFQRDLGSISDDMKTLQAQSVTINQELENRQKVRGELSQFVDDIMVAPNMVRSMVDADANDRVFLEQLHELQHKLQFVKAQEFKEARAVDDVQGILDGLRVKAIEKCREWILQKIYLFRKPLSNYQVPQHQLLKNRFFYEFLLTHDRNVAKEVQEEYIETTSKMFFSYFKVYTSRLFKLMMTDSASKDDLLGTEDVTKSSGLTALFSSKPQVRNRATVFSLGNRQNLLTDDFLSPLIVPHAAQEANEKFQFESLFRSIHFALVDHCSHEYLFLTDFFMVTGQAAVDLHKKVMSRAVTQLLRSWDEKVSCNYDAISLYLCICLCEKFHQLLTERSIPSMGGYWETISNQLWLRFDFVMNSHNESVRNLDVRKLQSPVDTRPHYIIRRYAELTCAFLVITEICNKEIGKKMESVLESNEDAVEQLIGRMASLFDTKESLVFLINNYDLILGILDERVAMDTRIHKIVTELNQKAIGEFVELSLSPHFASLISFVNECEQLVQQQHTHLLVRYNDKLVAVIRNFSQNWKRAIDSINGQIVKSFTNFKNGTNILQAAFTQLVSYYQRFTKVAAHDVFKDCPARDEVINTHHLMVELKKYKPVY